MHVSIMCSYFSHVVHDPQEQPTPIGMCMSSLYLERLINTVHRRRPIFIFQNLLDSSIVSYARFFFLPYLLMNAKVVDNGRPCM